MNTRRILAASVAATAALVLTPTSAAQAQRLPSTVATAYAISLPSTEHGAFTVKVDTNTPGRELIVQWNPPGPYYDFAQSEMTLNKNGDGSYGFDPVDAGVGRYDFLDRGSYKHGGTTYSAMIGAYTIRAESRRVTVRHPRYVRAGRTSTVTFRVDKARAGRGARLQERVNGTWRTVSATTINSARKASLRLPASRAKGTRWFRVEMRGERNRSGLYSKTFAVSTKTRRDAATFTQTARERTGTWTLVTPALQVVSKDLVTVTPGVPFSIEVDYFSASETPLTWSAGYLPDWATLDPATGTISGFVGEGSSGIATINLTARDTSGHAGYGEVTIAFGD